MDIPRPQGGEPGEIPTAPPKFDNVSLVKTVVLTIMFILSLIGNLVTVYKMTRHRQRSSTMNTLILQLAIADLIVTLFCIATEAVWQATIQWFAGNVMCKLIKFLEVFGLYLSTYILVIISLDRCCAILDPMSRNRAPRRIRIMIIIAWVLSVLFSSPQMVIFSVHRGPWKDEFYQCMVIPHISYSHEWQAKAYTLATLMLMFIVPLLIMIIAYALIFITIARKSKDIESESRSTEDMLRGRVRSHLLRRAKSKSLKMTAVIVAAFIICWTPYFVTYLCFTFSPDIANELGDTVFLWIFVSGMSNSAINPLIYGAFHVCRKRKRRQYTADGYIHGKQQSLGKSSGATKNALMPNKSLNKKDSLTNSTFVYMDNDGKEHSPMREREREREPTQQTTTPRRQLLVTYIITQDV
ncbi:gonadotropin-releasing hormone receptor-like [Tubulanus polymorphus]|uniref:gonadotropin-releasing hormone receptor-like n=1 Tax=Tubulanus polymorphus TaxID=672921 RepID=UPI003DA4E405